MEHQKGQILHKKQMRFSFITLERKNSTLTEIFQIPQQMAPFIFLLLFSFIYCLNLLLDFENASFHTLCL